MNDKTDEDRRPPDECSYDAPYDELYAAATTLWKTIEYNAEGCNDGAYSPVMLLAHQRLGEVLGIIGPLNLDLVRPDVTKCPICDGPADNGHDREYPPNPYICTQCVDERQCMEGLD